jgi:hypothetical protein
MKTQNREENKNQGGQEQCPDLTEAGAEKGDSQERDEQAGTVNMIRPGFS